MLPKAKTQLSEAVLGKHVSLKQMKRILLAEKKHFKKNPNITLSK